MSPISYEVQVRALVACMAAGGRGFFCRQKRRQVMEGLPKAGSLRWEKKTPPCSCPCPCGEKGEACRISADAPSNERPAFSALLPQDGSPQQGTGQARLARPQLRGEQNGRVDGRSALSMPMTDAQPPRWPTGSAWPSAARLFFFFFSPMNLADEGGCRGSKDDGREMMSSRAIHPLQSVLLPKKKKKKHILHPPRSPLTAW